MFVYILSITVMACSFCLYWIYSFISKLSFSNMFIIFYRFCLATDGLKMVEIFAICQKEKYTDSKYKKTSISILFIVW